MSLQTNRMTKQIVFRVYPDEMRDLDEICKYANRKKSDILRSWFRRMLDEHKESKHGSSADQDRSTSLSGVG